MLLEIGIVDTDGWSIGLALANKVQQPQSRAVKILGGVLQEILRARERAEEGRLRLRLLRREDPPARPAEGR